MNPPLDARYSDAIRELPDAPLDRTIALIGFMGIGKTTTGRQLARRLGWQLVDSDELVESRSNMTIREIFDWFGEPHFRDLEREVIAAETQAGKRVFSLGGGAFLDEASRGLLLDGCTVVYLAAPWSHILGLVERLKRTRPLLRSRTREELEAMFNQRHTIYDLAHLRVSVPGRPPRLVAERILELLGGSTPGGS